MKKAIIFAAILWAVVSVSVPVLKSIDLPGQNPAIASALSQNVDAADLELASR